MIQDSITYTTTLQLLGGPQGDNEEGIQTLRETRERLFEKGWKKGSYGGVGGPNCMVGALVLSSKVGYGKAYVALEKLVGYIPHFNDGEGTTFDGVVDAIDRAIKTLEEGN